jgi:hypothetical protein
MICREKSIPPARQALIHIGDGLRRQRRFVFAMAIC